MTHPFRLRGATLGLAAIALLTCVLLSSGSLNSIDTLNRLQVTHALWTHEPQVPDPGDYGFSVEGRGHAYYVTWGIGQSLAMLPADIIGTALTAPFHLHGAAAVIRTAVVSYLTFPIINTASIVLALLLLLELGFSEFQARMGCLAFLFGTTFLSYAQVHDEDSLTLLCVIAGYLGTLRWIRLRRTRDLCLAGSALGLSLLIRLPESANVVAVLIFGTSILLQPRPGRTHALQDRRSSAVRYVATIAIFYLPFIAIDRAYQWLRFGSITTTYTSLWGAQMRRLYPQLPPDFPFSTPFIHGFFGQLTGLDRSVFLFNPLLAVTGLIVVRAWSQLTTALRAFVIANAFLLFADIAFYARWFEWGGAGSWGPRYAIVPSELLALVAVPLMMKGFAVMAGLGLRILMGSLLLVSFVIQIASVLYDYNLELYQETTFGLTYVVVWQRLVNIVAFATGNFARWGLTPHRSAAEVRRVINPAFMPWRTSDELPHAVSTALQFGWFVGLIVLIGLVVIFVRRSLRSRDVESRMNAST